MRSDHIRWDEIRSYHIRSDQMRWVDMRWDQMIWDDQIRWDQMISDEMRWDEMISDEILWDEMRWDEMSDLIWSDLRWDKMRWDEMRWDEMILDPSFVGKVPVVLALGLHIWQRRRHGKSTWTSFTLGIIIFKFLILTFRSLLLILSFLECLIVHGRGDQIIAVGSEESPSHSQHTDGSSFCSVYSRK